MKFKIVMKDPDGVWDAVEEAAIKSVGVGLPDLDGDERDIITKKRIEGLNKQLCKWFEHGEYLTVEIDTEANTATVLEAQQ